MDRTQLAKKLTRLARDVVSGRDDFEDFFGVPRPKPEKLEKEMETVIDVVESAIAEYRKGHKSEEGLKSALDRAVSSIENIIRRHGGEISGRDF